MRHVQQHVDRDSTAMILQAIDKTIADVTAQDGAGAAAKIDALRQMRERVVAQQRKDTNQKTDT